MRRVGRYKRKKQRKILIIGSLSLLLFLCVGYAAFSTNLSITAKGNIKYKKASEVLRKVCNTESGDGLYKDIYEDGRCIYKGGNPNNYIVFNDELWRIVSLESDNTIKIVKLNGIKKMSWDVGGTSENSRYSNDEEDYCSIINNGIYYGCNVWGNNITMYNNNGDVLKQIPYAYYLLDSYNLPSKSAYVNTFLNEDYYNSIPESYKKYIVSHFFDVGFISYDTSGNQLFVDDKKQEQMYKWKGYVGLPSAFDYAFATTNERCYGVYSYMDFEACYSNIEKYNWYANTDYRFWTINALAGQDYGLGVWYVSTNGTMNHPYVSNSDYNVRPVIFLNSTITLFGQGTEQDPYVIIN